MGLLETLLGGTAERSETADATDPLQGALHDFLAQNGGIQGLMGKFSQGGLGDVFSSWVGMGQNKAVSTSQIQNVLGPDQVNALAAQLGVDPAKASGFLAHYLPKIVDKLTPTGQVELATDQQQQGLAALLPSLLQNLGGERRQA